MSISAEEFEALNLQLIDLKTSKYESQDRERKLNHEIKALKEQVATLENEVKKAHGVISKSKDKKEIQALMNENDQLSRNLQLASQEHREQQEAMMQNVKNLYASNKELEDDVENYKKSLQEKDKRIETLEVQHRKIQLQLLHFETSADILSSPSSGRPNGGSAPSQNEGGGEGEQGDKGSVVEGGDEGNKSQLEEENSRLRENVRLLSTQMRELDSQLAKSDESNRTLIASLEQQLSAQREKIKQDEISTARMEARLESELGRLIQDKEGLVTKLSHQEEQAKKDRASLDHLDRLKDQLAELNNTANSLRTSRDEYMEQSKKLTAQHDSVLHAKDALQAKLSELESEAGLLRKVRDEHSTLLFQSENTKNQLNTVEAALQTAKADIVTLREHKKELESKLAETKRELESALQGLASLTEERNSRTKELETVKEECMSLSRSHARVGELESEVHTLKMAHVHAVAESATHKEQWEAEVQKLAALEANVSELNVKLEEARSQSETLAAQVKQLQTEKSDLETEFKIQDRKSQRMVKELKAELQRERSTLGRSTSMDQLAPSTPSTPRQSPPLSPVPLTPPPHHHHHTNNATTPRMSRQQSEVINSLPLLSSSLSNMELSQATMEEVLRRDLDTALTMVGKLGEDKWKLEEKTRFLEENLASVNGDLVRKTEVIRYYAMKTKQIVTSDHLMAEKDKHRRQSGVLGTLMRSGDQNLSAELLSKMEAILEETVLKNIQLQNDMVTLANETSQLQKTVASLKEENKRYEEQIIRITSSHH